MEEKMIRLLFQLFCFGFAIDKLSNAVNHNSEQPDDEDEFLEEEHSELFE
jgi:hypothetical protein